MAIDPEQALGVEVHCGVTEWSPDDVILYHLAVGAGVPPTAADELEYTYERGLKVLPTFAVTQVAGLMANALKVPGLDFDAATLLHGGHDLEIVRPVQPAASRVETTSKIAAIYDKGHAAVVVVEFDSKQDGETLFINRFSLFLRGEGGFGGHAAPAPDHERPAREPDLQTEWQTVPQQALIYRLTGDKHPLHADPRYAAKGGFDRPILHGLCTYGAACKAAVDHVLGGDTTTVRRYQARFSGVVFPGETIVTSMWSEGGKVLLAATVKERPGKPVLTNAAITIGPAS